MSDTSSNNSLNASFNASFNPFSSPLQGFPFPQFKQETPKGKEWSMQDYQNFYSGATGAGGAAFPGTPTPGPQATQPWGYGNNAMNQFPSSWSNWNEMQAAANQQFFANNFPYYNGLNNGFNNGFANPYNMGLNNGSNGYTRKRRNLFTANQVAELEKIFKHTKFLKPEQRDEIAKKTGLTSTQVKIWFQNRRYKNKKAQEADNSMSDENRDPANTTA